MGATRYVARPGGPLTDEQANLVGCEMDAMEEAGEQVIPRNLLARARSAKSALHTLFEWDDDAAGESWRLHQAGMFMQSVRILVKDRPVHARASLHVELKDTKKRRRERVRRDVIEKSDEHMRELSMDLYQRLVVVVDAADSWGLTRRAPWSDIARVVRARAPK